MLTKGTILRILSSLLRTKTTLLRCIVLNGSVLLFVAVAILQIGMGTLTFRGIDADLLNQSFLLAQQTTQSREAPTATLNEAVLAARPHPSGLAPRLKPSCCRWPGPCWRVSLPWPVATSDSRGVVRAELASGQPAARCAGQPGVAPWRRPGCRCSCLRPVVALG